MLDTRERPSPSVAVNRKIIGALLGFLDYLIIWLIINDYLIIFKNNYWLYCKNIFDYLIILKIYTDYLIILTHRIIDYIAKTFLINWLSWKFIVIIWLSGPPLTGPHEMTIYQTALSFSPCWCCNHVVNNNKGTSGFDYFISGLVFTPFSAILWIKQTCQHGSFCHLIITGCLYTLSSRFRR